MTTENTVWPLAEIDVPESLLSWISEHAQDIDSGVLTTRGVFPDLGEAGLLDLGSDKSADSTLAQQAAVIEVLAQHSFSVAFSLWGHRMVLEFLEITGGSYANSVLPALHTGTTPGASAMAPGYKSLANASDLALSITREENGRLYLSGEVAWASNLYGDAIAVAPAYGPETANRQGSQGGVIVAFPLDATGVEIGPKLDILAMRGTASTYVSLDRVEISEHQILTNDFSDFLKNTRPTLSILQASLCLGLATASYHRSLENATGFNAVFRSEIQEYGTKLESTKQQLTQHATKVGADQPVSSQDILAMRLRAGQLATQLTTLEIKTAGGKAFMTTSDVNRRYREASFIPLQAPSEAQLRWELSQG